MKAELINPFLQATLNTLSMMASTQAVPGKISLKPDRFARGAVTGIIGLAGENVSGNMILSFEAPAILSIVSKMVGEELTELGDDAADAVGELTNMICGAAKVNLAELGYNIAMATPMILTGEKIELKQLSKGPVVTIPFESKAGHFWLEASLEKTKA